jgi:hypothetical protein
MKLTAHLDKKGITHTVSADGLVTIHGDLNLYHVKTAIDFSALEGIQGSLYLRGYEHEFNAPLLASIQGSLDLRGYAHEFNAPLLASTGSLDLRGYEHEFNAPLLASTGSLYLQGYAHEFNAPLLASTGSLDLRGYEHEFNAPLLASIQGYLYLRGYAHEFNAPLLASIQGSLYLRGYAHEFNAPLLASIQGSLYLRGYAHEFNAPLLTEIEKIYFTGKIFGQEFEIIDGIPAIILSAKEKDGISIKRCRESQMSKGKFMGDIFYVTTKGVFSAHGETIRDATEELAFKTGNRDVSKYKNMPSDTKKTPDEWALVYRMVTGACRYGTREFMKSRKLKKKYTLNEIIEETKGAFGHDQFVSVVKGTANV